MALSLNRRTFLADVGSLFGLAVVPNLVRADAMPAPAKAPNLVLGVLSDTHLRRQRRVGGKYERPASAFPTTYWRRALTFFRDQGVDAVVHCGDLAHRGLVCELKFHADIWFKVFPDNKGKDGRTVEKLFVTGNHDWEGSTYMDFGAEIYPDPEVRKRYVLATDMARNWQAIWHEPYSRSWHKCVKGYHFFGEHFEGKYQELPAKIAARARKDRLAGTRPFFVLQHKVPQIGLRQVLAKYPNALALFGHWHQSLASERVILYRSFPMVQCGSLFRNAHMDVPGCRFDREEEARLIEARGERNSRQGLLIKVYDDRLVFCRRDFISEAPLGPDWVMPLGRYQPHPFDAKVLAATVGAPAFPKTAKLAATHGTDGLVVEIPQANAAPQTRAYAFDLRITRSNGKTVFQRGYHAAGCNFAPTSKNAQAVTTVKIPSDTLPAAGTLVIQATPVSALGRRGSALKMKKILSPIDGMKKEE